MTVGTLVIHAAIVVGNVIVVGEILYRVRYNEYKRLGYHHPEEIADRSFCYLTVFAYLIIIILIILALIILIINWNEPLYTNN